MKVDQIQMNFSLFTDGLGTEVNDEGIMYYNNLINYLLEKGMN